MAPRTNRATRIPSGVASPVCTNHAAKGSVFVDLRNVGDLKKWPLAPFPLGRSSPNCSTRFAL